MIKLVCINSRAIKKTSLTSGKIRNHGGWALRKGRRYTASALTISEDGHLSYIINEIPEKDCQIKLIERFQEVPTYTPAKTAKKKNAIKK